MSRRMWTVMAVLPVFLVACGEYKQKVEYENGGYEGKHDQRAWDSARFMQDPSVWKQIVNERTQRQNEYERTGD